MLDYCPIAFPSRRVVALCERDPPEAEMLLRQEILRREKTLETVLLFPFAVENQQRRRPQRPEALERSRLISYVKFAGDKVLVDKPGDSLVRVDLGIQPSTSPSHGSGREVEKGRAALLPGLREHRVGIVIPFDWHA